MAGHHVDVSAAVSFEDVVNEVYEPLQRYLRRRTDPTTAEDVLADVLLVLWRRVDDIPAGASLPWSYGVARGCLANSRRGADRHLRLIRRLAAEPVTAAVSPTEADAVEDPVFDQALSSLPAGAREVLRLWAWEDLAPREIALVLGISANAASIRLHRATAKLKRELVRRKDTGTPGHLVEQAGMEEK